MAIKVLNASDEALRDGQIRVLSLGLSFCPTPKSDIHEAEKDIYYFSWKIRLKYHFSNLESSIIPERTAEPDSLIKIPSSFTPRKRVHTELENLLLGHFWVLPHLSLCFHNRLWNGNTFWQLLQVGLSNWNDEMRNVANKRKY